MSVDVLLRFTIYDSRFMLWILSDLAKVRLADGFAVYCLPFAVCCLRLLFTASLCLSKFVNGQDVWMVKRRDGAGFLNKALQALLV
jgi:hypothetical protein